VESQRGCTLVVVDSRFGHGTMTRREIARRVVAVCLFAGVSWPALAQTPEELAGAQGWFRDYIQPSLGRHIDDMSIEEQPLYEPNEARGVPGRLPADRRIYRHQLEVGDVRAVVLAGDLPPTRAEWIDARDWNDASAGNPMRAEMFRFYFEPVAPTRPICRAIVP